MAAASSLPTGIVDNFVDMMTVRGVVFPGSFAVVRTASDIPFGPGAPRTEPLFP